MSYDVRYSETFRRGAKTLAKKYPSLKQDISDFVIELAENPNMGTPLGNNMYKVRMAIRNKGRGKSGGARIITCVVYKRDQILLAEI
jgi:mRNA-degrading endonuclease RelE of RelBE toxin-antitoxin system